MFFNSKIPSCGAIIHLNEKIIFLDYSDDVTFLNDPKKYNFYFKRSLKFENYFQNVYPLNFQVNYSYKALNFLTKLSFKELVNKRNRIEIARGVDYFNLFINLSHNAMDIRNFPKEISDNEGKVVFYSRLWNPDNHSDAEEKERRRKQNEFRINACRLNKKIYKNSSVGLMVDVFSTQLAPDLILDSKHSNKKNYFETLKNCNICIADDGLKDTPGWKIGEYLLFGKAVITTPLNVIIENFDEHVNYEKLSTRNSYLELPDKIDFLIKEKKYLEMGENNLMWSENYLHPKNYIKRIMSVLESNSKK